MTWIVGITDPALDRFFVSRLLLGALWEHEQRRALADLRGRLQRIGAAFRPGKRP